MFTRTILCITVIIALIAVAGCSDDTIEIIKSEGDITTTQSAVEAYFPVTEGYTTTYSVRNSNGTNEIVIFKAGETIQYGSLDLIEWTGKSASGFEKNYIRITDEAVYLYETTTSIPEKILQLPLTPGSSWLRFDDVTISDTIIDITTGEVDTTGGTSNKIVPTVGAITMSVDDIEQLSLTDGSYYSNVVKIYNENGDSKNFYYFAPGVGLVRYVIGAYDSEGNTGEVVGELVSFGY